MTDNPKKPLIDPKTLKKLLPAEREALRIKAQNPDYTNTQIGKELKQLGLTKDKSYVSKRLKRSELLRLELSKVFNGLKTFGALQLSASDTDKRKQGDCDPEKKPRLPPKIIPLKPVLIVPSRFFHYLCV